MSYQLLLTVLGIGLILLGCIERQGFLITIWFGIDFLVLGVAYGCGAHRVFGKRDDGILPLWSWVAFFPLLIYTKCLWHCVRLFSREPAQNSVTEQLVVGRRLLPAELEGEFENIVDLTAEFSEPFSIRISPAYRCFPILDGVAPAPDALRAAVASLRPGRTFVHCAQGHGRTGLFALAVLLRTGAARNIEEGLQILTAARPAIRLSPDQRLCIQKFVAAGN